jgi:hypothetical protein
MVAVFTQELVAAFNLRGPYDDMPAVTTSAGFAPTRTNGHMIQSN